MNSREKGKRGERAWRDELRAQGFDARRGQQFSGSPESPDVICDQLSWIHFEVKCVERLNIEDAMAQARRDSRMTKDECRIPKVPIVAHKRNFCGWLITMDAETFFRFLRGDFCEPRMNTDEHRFGGAHGVTRPTSETIWASQQQRPTAETETNTKQKEQNV